VVNIITKHDFRGCNSTAATAAPSAMAAARHDQFGVLAGFGDLNADRFNVTPPELLQVERLHARRPRSTRNQISPISRRLSLLAPSYWSMPARRAGVERLSVRRVGTSRRHQLADCRIGGHGLRLHTGKARLSADD